MRIDVITIFPDYLAPLSLSLPGKAVASGLLDVAVHDLREWTTDRHRTVDDTPYGGGAGMVMCPEPWGAALDAVLPEDGDAVLVVPTPSGEPFRQSVAEELAAERHLVFACGRYEGIDQRVLDEAATRVRVREVSLGDYVLNGGEVAALAVIEAVVRLLPGFMGNPASLQEESHGSDGLLEYPVYTKPSTWRGHDVPAVLLSGDHAKIAAWRRDEALRRTAERRPELLHPSQALVVSGLEGAEVRPAVAGDAAELMTLQRAGWASVGTDQDPERLQVLAEDLDDVRVGIEETTTLVVRLAGRLVASSRARRDGGTWLIERLVVAPDLQRRGLGAALLEHLALAAPPRVQRVEVGTRGRGNAEQKFFRRAGFRPARGATADTARVHGVRMTRRPGP
ncbi:MAG: tRNA (guanosine(37)-N1)-methyltransferase TrmD [Nocardioides sp.]|nr:tRNA (guanosine(37)-N1)-methyltransferase TrmD [Nocardioides sp.]